MSPFANFIAGSWAGSDRLIDNVNPSDTNDLIGRYAQATPDQVEAAVAAAHDALPAWNAKGLEARADVLDRVGRELMARAEELGAQLSREEGKPLAEGKGEVYRAGQFFTYYAGEVLRQIGDTAQSVRQGVDITVTREPVGVVAVISPWNFPMATACWKIAPALAFGNAVVWKPANQTPASAWALAEIFSRQDIPAGLFNLVMGSGGSVGGRLAAHPQVNAISFTGSVEVGRQVAAAAISNLTKLQMEMGSKNPLLVMEDADLDIAAALAVSGAFGGTGQKCTASSRLIVHEAVHDDFVERCVARARALEVGHALEPKTEIGPVVSAQQLDSNLDYVALARSAGCELVTGGGRLERATPGFFMEPTLFTGTRNDMRVNQEEMFGPIACVIPASGFEEAVAIANDTRYGLTAGIVTRSIAYATEFRRRSRSGCVMVNLPTAGTDYHVPFGGMKMSSYGPREQGAYAAEFYTTVKTAYIQPGPVA
ncbi:aldehyde dehydrogenase family protein [Nitratireductor alexandrii]|uniref:aldehyde dehydrogenase family protein n=1 Tax=Nitratireductor alexandrii TaxID=2448161 RepID=UPI000FDB433F|nr:aldehyde dehydrogenase family protein [Nitratireductor alexandrii]